MTSDCRAVSSVIGVILLVAVVVLATVAAGYLVALSEDVNEPAPVVSESTGEFIAGSERDEQVVKITHNAGDSLDVTELEIAVDAPDCNTADRVEGDDDLIDTRNGEAGALIGTAADELGFEDGDNTFSAGKTIEFRIASGGCDFTDENNEDLTVRIVHNPSESVVITQELSA